jgi:hypothetical protein
MDDRTGHPKSYVPLLGDLWLPVDWSRVVEVVHAFSFEAPCIVLGGITYCGRPDHDVLVQPLSALHMRYVVPVTELEDGHRWRLQRRRKHHE